MTRKCYSCNEIIKKCTAYISCHNYNHYYHKKCIKEEYIHNYNKILDTRYDYSSISNYYKHHQCCGKKVIINNTLKYKVKKVLKFSWPLVFIILL